MTKYFTNHFESDMAIMYQIIDELEIKTSTDRRVAYKKYFGETPPKGSGSATWGYTKRSYLTPTRNRKPSIYKGLYETKLKSEKPELEDIFKEFASIYIPDYFFSEVQINKNYPIQPHRDKGNLGESYIIGLGDYSGGELILQVDGKIKMIDIKNNFFKFDGCKYTHYVNKFIGNRISLVFYTQKTKEQYIELSSHLE